jgi:hypothetical protein
MLVLANVSVSVLFSLVIITEGRQLTVRGPANIHIESDGLYSCGAKLLALGLFLVIEGGCWGRRTDLDYFWKE